METKTLTDVALAVRIIPNRVRWPKRGASTAWAAAHSYVRELESVVRDVESKCLQAQNDHGLQPTALRNRRSDICREAIANLTTFKPLAMARKALSERVSALEKFDERSPDQVKSLDQMRQAIRDLEPGIGAAQRTILDLCRVKVAAPV